MSDTINSQADFVAGLQTLWSIESQLVDALPLMVEKASNLGLKKNLALHLAETGQQKVAIEGMCKQLGYEHEGAQDEGLNTILQEGQQTLSTLSTSDDADAAIIESAIKVEHYEIERYTAIAGAIEALGYEAIAARLYLSLEEERQADAKLNFLKKVLVEKTAVIGAPGLALK